MPDEVKPLPESGEVEVSPEAVQPAAKQFKPKNCKGCGETFRPTSSNQQNCASCMPSKETYNAVRLKEAKARKKEEAKADTASRTPKSVVEIKAKEARRILMEERGIQNQRVVDVCVEHAEIAARNLRVPFNASLFSLGLQGTLAKINKTPAPQIPAAEWYAGERVREHELYAMWDYTTSWRVQPDGSKIGFETWKEYRRRCITDLVWFANTVLGKSFEQEPHGKWATELFPQLENALLALPEKFGQKDIAAAFHLISDVRQRCLISARSSFKSTFSTVFMLQMMLCFAGSLRILVTTATQPLAKGFAKAFRNLVTLRDPNNATLMNQLWPEHCIAADDGKQLEYTSPFRQLDVLIEPTLFITSVISEGQAGSRYDYGIFDDCAEIANSSNVEMREKTQERIDMLRELGEPHSLTTYVGTPISQGSGTEDDPGDLYSVVLRREEKNLKEGGEPKLLWAICPAWTVKPGVSKKAWDANLTEAEVDLLFPSRLTFKYLMAKLKENLATDSSAKIFRQQSLVSWVPDDETQIMMQFTEEALRSKLRGRGFFDATNLPGTSVYMALDRAWSVAATADFSSIAVGRVQNVVDNKKTEQALVVLDVSFNRWKESGLIDAICKMVERHNPSAFVMEKDRGYEELIAGVKKQCMLRGLSLPYIVLRDVKNSAQAKAAKVKVLEAPLQDSRLWFCSGSWNDAAFQQFVRFDGVKKSGSSDGSKDDIPDSIALLYSVWGPRAIDYQPQDPEEQRRRQEELEEEGAEQRKQHFYQRMFSGDTKPQAPAITEDPQPAKPQDPRMKVFGNRGPWRL